MNTASGSARAAAVTGMLAVTAALPAAAPTPTPPPAHAVPLSAAPLLAGPAGSPHAGAPRAASQPWNDTVTTLGRLVWEGADGTIGRCSGATVDAPNGSVVATAAHCLRDPADPDAGAERAAGAWFVPDAAGDAALDDDHRTHGWPVTGFHLPDGWDTEQGLHGALPHDYAFVTVADRDGRTLQEEYGANRLAVEPVPEDRSVTALGYPAVPPHDGRTAHHCTGPTRILTPDEAADANVGGLLLEDCDLARGASGGPWLQDFEPGDQSGTLVGVTSVGNNEGDVVGRPYPAEARELHAAAGSDARS